jgi:hypothetical protein
MSRGLRSARRDDTPGSSVNESTPPEGIPDPTACSATPSGWRNSWDPCPGVSLALNPRLMSRTPAG